MNMGIALAVLWSVVLIVAIGVYIPRKRKNIKSHSMDRVTITDKTIFRPSKDALVSLFVRTKIDVFYEERTKEKKTFAR